jgi:endonuclease YncB( thermonuclease family)
MEKQAMRKALAVLACAILAPSASLAVDARFQLHPVRAVPNGDRLVVEYAGLPVTVRLVHLAFPSSPDALSSARAAIEQLVKGKRVRVAYCPEAGLDAEGLPQVYVTAGIRNVNEQLVRKGLARYDPAPKRSKHYHIKMTSADAAARRARAGIWGSGEAAATTRARTVAAVSRGRAAGPVGAKEPPGVVYSELSSSMYHLPSCPWAHRMSAQRRIRYRSSQAAERAGKKPCWSCMGERAKKQAFGSPAVRARARVVAGKGPLVGRKGFFHAPNCERILAKPAGELESFGSVSQAKGKGLKPCERCLRLGGGPIPLPGHGECAGRAPPHRRPCRRAPAGGSGVCLYCQGKGE